MAMGEVVSAGIAKRLGIISAGELPAAAEISAVLFW
jgi:hypothetical protein